MGACSRTSSRLWIRKVRILQLNTRWENGAKERTDKQVGNKGSGISSGVGTSTSTGTSGQVDKWTSTRTSCCIRKEGNNRRVVKSSEIKRNQAKRTNANYENRQNRNKVKLIRKQFSYIWGFQFNASSSSSPGCQGTSWYLAEELYKVFKGPMQDNRQGYFEDPIQGSRQRNG